MSSRNPNAPPNPLDRANIFSLDDLQVTSVPVGCKNPYIRYATKQPIPLGATYNALSFTPLVRFPTLGFRHVSAQLWCQYPPGAPLPAYVHYYLAEHRDAAPVSPLTGGVVSPPYNQAVEQTEFNSKDLALFVRVASRVGFFGPPAQVLFSFSVLVEP